ncbi:peptidoglycan editing factor PgeF [Niveibacterium umoris]|uniref:Purine nucleoside phosphorylase n=1 Tax=Niveibacterium umoris TaxID=1193620 RepID=A0A840BDM5_9RHOO|nr:peptidoglycan editing factor PgeF [Niveibacterium umoris]MBB4011195.1 hypothetical protein [Niveibacterium umoris]
MTEWLIPEWPAPRNVRALFSTRKGGVSLPPYAGLNLGTHVGDDPVAVAANRQRVRAHVPAEPCWLEQVHGTQVVDADAPLSRIADAATTREANAVCVVMVADCLPVLFCNRAGSVVGAAHAGWRGLHAGVLEATIARMDVAPEDLLVWLGPAIGPKHFEVGPEVRAAFVESSPEDADCFAAGEGDRWMADLFGLAKARLARAGVGAGAVFGGKRCTVSDRESFYSYRRDGRSGRMGAFIWMEGNLPAA